MNPVERQEALADALVDSVFDRMGVEIPPAIASRVVADLAKASRGALRDAPAAKPQHALVLIGSTADSSSAESTLFVRDLQSEAVFKIQGVRV